MTAKPQPPKPPHPPRGAHLVGSIPLDSTDEVFAAAGRALPGHLRRVPDGEVGERRDWINWQSPVFAQHPALEPAPATDGGYGPAERYRPKPGVDVDAIRFGPLGYAAQASRSYARFRHARDTGQVPPGWRFMVALPTPLAPVNRFVDPAHRAALEPAYEAAMARELAAIADAVPHEELAIQWDVAHEIGIWEGFFPAFYDGDPQQGSITRLGRLAAAVPDGVELGFHLCYGDFGHRHFVQPRDAGVLTAVAGALADAVPRPIHWLHLPVPRDRDDDAYFAPLADLRLRPETELYLGLVHLTDGVEGTRRRIAAAARSVAAFGVATECGFGRRDPGDVPALLRIHAAVADPFRAGAALP